MDQQKVNNLLPHLFRQEYSRMTALLCRHFGLQHIEMAEDIASDTFLRASEHWALNGIPDNPAAWLYTVAKNKTRDYLRRISNFENRVKDSQRQDEVLSELDFEINSRIIEDSQLAMIFAVCNPLIAPESQICLALQVLCGFSVEEIANAFLARKETIKKRLLRARADLRNGNFQLNELNEHTIKSRLDTVLKTLYLLFNEGYFSKSDRQLIRRELCSEAVRLTLLLTGHESTNITQVQALLALMCYQSSRLEARLNANGEVILFDEQDRSLWDQSLIDRGNYHLINACNGEEVSKYHLEAAIAYWHTTPAGNTKWEQILQLYNQLIQIEYSPVVALNRVFAFSKVYGNQNAILEINKLNLTGHAYYHAMLGHLYIGIDSNKAVAYYERAIQLSESPMEKQVLLNEVARIA
ncbi:RNA polymerase sigma factor [Chitinophaga sp. HK235]|uniref:RNA polymerase sigma factor n=1 Tax=Chitinophaga sp. HK235 TaxID=2952571 RepID=UPI002012DD93|nr:sigma-70 family RNA polymerase sigma factor [Chitinophaga sp. HK235]